MKHTIQDPELGIINLEKGLTKEQRELVEKSSYFTIQEVADLLKVAYLTVYRWIKAGKLSAYQVEKQYRINKTDFDAFMQSYKIKKK